MYKNNFVFAKRYREILLKIERSEYKSKIFNSGIKVSPLDRSSLSLFVILREQQTQETANDSRFSNSHNANSSSHCFSIHRSGIRMHTKERKQASVASVYQCVARMRKLFSLANFSRVDPPSMELHFPRLHLHRRCGQSR